MVSSKCQPLVVGTEGLLEGVFKMFLWCPSVTVASGEFSIQGYLGQAMAPPFWRHVLPSVAVTSATYLLCWWFLPAQGHQHWRYSYPSECCGWCGDNADGSTQGVVDGGGRLPMTQSHTAGWWIWQPDRGWSPIFLLCFLSGYYIRNVDTVIGTISTLLSNHYHMKRSSPYWRSTS